MFGWAKPVPFNPINLRDRRWGEIFIAVAGPASNVILVIIFAILYKVIFASSIVSPESLGELGQPVYTMLSIGITLNIILAVFNMIPIPPLDGHHVLRNLLPDSMAESFAQASPMIGLIGMVLLISTGFAGYLINPISHLVWSLLR
jgi:Zn-dependent protease